MTFQRNEITRESITAEVLEQLKSIPPSQLFVPKTYLHYIPDLTTLNGTTNENELGGAPKISAGKAFKAEEVGLAYYYNANFVGQRITEVLNVILMNDDYQNRNIYTCIYIYFCRKNFP